MALAVDGERSLRVNADIEDLLALRPDPCKGVRAGGDGAPSGGVAWGLRAGFGVACSPADQPRALQGAWSQVVKPDTRRALLLRVHAPGDFNPKSALWTAWREGLQPHCRERNAAAAASIKRYGLKLVASKPYKLSADPRERDLANPALVTGAAGGT